MIRIFICIIFFAFFSSKAFGRENNYNFCNQHKFTFLLLDVYDVKLCAQNRSQLRLDSIYQETFSLIINYNMNFDKEELSASSIKEINRYYHLSQKEQDAYYKKLMLIFPDVKKGDVIEANYKKDGHTDFYHNKSLRGSIDNQKFSEIFLNIWLHKNNKYQSMVKDLFKKYE